MIYQIVTQQELMQSHTLAALYASQDGHLPKKILYAKLIYCDHPSKNVEHPNLRITKIWVQQK